MRVEDLIHLLKTRCNPKDGLRAVARVETPFTDGGIKEIFLGSLVDDDLTVAGNLEVDGSGSVLLVSKELVHNLFASFYAKRFELKDVLDESAMKAIDELR